MHAALQHFLLETTVAVGDAPVGIAFDGTHIWVTNYNDNTVSRIDVSNYVGADVDVGSSPSDAAVDGNNIWVANRDDDTVSKLVP